MAEDVATIEVRLRTEYPALTAVINKQPVTLDAAAYERRIGEMAVAVQQQQLAAEAEATRKALRDAVRTARTRLNQIATATPPFTNTQRDAAIQDIANYLNKLVGVLIDRGQIEAS